MMSWWEDHKTKKEVKKANKKLVGAEKTVETLKGANIELEKIDKDKPDVNSNRRVEEEYNKYLKSSIREEDISMAREKLFIQRNRALCYMLNHTKEYQYLLSQPESPIRQSELNRCSTAAKNAAYALAVIEEAISRLDSIHTEVQWQEIMSDLAKGYKMVNEISVGADLMTRLAFLWNKAVYDMKNKVTVKTMEHYYGKSIDKLLQEQYVDKRASDILVKDDILKMDNEEQIMQAVRLGTMYNVQPRDLANGAEEQSREARSSRGTPVYEEPVRPIKSPADLDNELDGLDRF